MSLSDWMNIYLFAYSNRSTKRAHLVPAEPWSSALCGIDINRDSLRDTFPTDAVVCPTCQHIARNS